MSQTQQPSETLSSSSSSSITTKASINVQPSVIVTTATSWVYTRGTSVPVAQPQTWVNSPPSSATEGYWMTVDSDGNTWYMPAASPTSSPVTTGHDVGQIVGYPMKMVLGPVFAFVGFLVIVGIYFVWRKYIRRNEAQETSPGQPASTKKPKKALLTDEQFDSLPTEASKPKGEQEPEACAICLSDFRAGEILVTLPCNHVFHKDCVRTWLTEKSETCPLCKESVSAGLGIADDSDVSIDIVEHVAPLEPEPVHPRESHELRHL